MRSKARNCFWTWAGLCFFLSVTLNSALGTNLLNNGGFENGTANGWAPWPLTVVTTTILSDGGGEEGTYYCRVQLNNSDTWGILVQDFGDLTARGYAAGDTLRFSAWFKTGTDVNPNCQTILRRCWGKNGLGGELDSTTYEIQASNVGQQTTWKQLSADFPLLGLPYNTLRIYLENQNLTNGPATFYWDDAQLSVLGNATDPFVGLIDLDQASITIKPGTFNTATGSVEVKTTATFAVDPAEIINVTDESVLLSTTPPSSWGNGTKLNGPNARDINAGGSFVVGSLTMRTASGGGGTLLTEGVDYLLSPEFAMVGLAPGSPLSSTVPVYATYQYGRLRVDSIEVDSLGQPHLLKGTANISIPQPPSLTTGSSRLLNIFRPYHATVINREDIYPILERSDQTVTQSTSGRIPKTLAKLNAGQPVTIVCLGDSVTAGGNSSTPDKMYVEVFRQKLQAKYTPSQINLSNISVGGSNSSMWLSGSLRSNFDQILALHPDLVTVEFVNDAWLDQSGVNSQYGQLMNELQGVGAELIFITPHFTALSPMGATNLRTDETRPYVQAVRNFANANNLGIADASPRWAHLWKEGIPYITELDNTYNHPDDRGHLMFAEELMKNFVSAVKPTFTADYFAFENLINRPGKTCRVLAKLTYKGGGPANSVSFQLQLPANLHAVGGVDTCPLNRPLDVGESFFATWDITADSEGSYNVSANLLVSGDQMDIFNTTLKIDPPLTLPQSDYVPVPKPVNMPIDVGVNYFPGWAARARWCGIRYMDPKRKPVLGYYNETSPEVVDWQIKYYVENGVNTILLDWYSVDGHQWYNHWLNAYRNARYRNMIKLGLLWCNHYPGTHTRENFLAVIQFYIDNIFSFPSYYKIDGKPAVFIYQPSVLRNDLGGSANIASAISEAKTMAANAGFGGITFISYEPASQQLVDEGYSGDARYNGLTTAENINPSFISYPVAGTGWAPGPWYSDGNIDGDGRTPDGFKNSLTAIKNFIQTRPKQLIVLGPDAEWGEGSYVLPTNRFGFGMLEKVREVFSTDPATSWPLNYAPGDVGRGPLYEYPDPLPTPLWTFDTGVEGWGDYWCTQDIRAEGGQLKYHGTLNNPAICVDVPFIRASKYNKAIIQMKIEGAPNTTVNAHLDWSIKGANFPSECMVQFPVQTDGQMHTYTVDLSTNPNWTSTINSFRFVPCNFNEIDVTIEQIELVESAPTATPTITPTPTATPIQSPTPTPAPTLTPVPNLIVTNISPSSYVLATDDLQVNKSVYIDRPYIFNDPIPSKLYKKTYILTAQADKDSSLDSLLSFDVNRDVVIYVAVDPRIAPLPAWLSSWAFMSDELSLTDPGSPSRKLYSKRFSPGHITLGPNRDSSMTMGYSMYTVIITPVITGAKDWTLYSQLSTGKE